MAQLENPTTLVREQVLDSAHFVQLSMKGKVRLGYETPWRMITVRPVEIKGLRHLQFAYFDQRQNITKNYADEEAIEQLDAVLDIPFSNIHVRTTLQDTQIQITKKGKAFINTSEPPQDVQVELAHDAKKALPLAEDAPNAYLQAVGIMNANGEIRPKMRAKFNQINEFLKILEHTGELDSLHNRPVRIVDFGCGSAYLSLAAYHYLNEVRGIPSMLDGVDNNGTLIDKNSLHSRELGYDDACFTDSAIADFELTFQPDIVISLHACDTATDDTLMQGIRNHAQIILSAPCCHAHLHHQLETVDPLRPILRHGILKKRMADIVTDSFRALILRIYGYSTDVIEFVASEHTDRNLMIRAIRRDPVDTAAFVEEYLALKAFWGVTPYLETLLGEDFQATLEG
ncbi:MAG: SAM-dependent methyltransferase [Aggregatilineales bacterium]